MKDLPKLLDKTSFDTVIDNKPVSLYTLSSGNGLIVQTTNFGLHVVSIWCKDKAGHYDDVTLGYKDINSYSNGENDRYVGSIVGRYANRIAKGTFELDGKTYTLPINNNGQSLHGGLKGLDLQVWDVVRATDAEVEFSFKSPDGSEGYPGNIEINVKYSVTPDNEFRIDYKAVTDKPTVINLSNHAFFNLKGEGEGTITDHVMTINAKHFVPVDDVMIPTGEILKVEGTPFDFTKPHAIGERINQTDNEQIKFGAGYDHTWVIDKKTESVELIATLSEPTTGRKLEVYTDQPGVQCYTGNWFDGHSTGKHGKTFKRREGVALETQKFPDSPNRKYFPSTRLNSGETYEQTTIYKFGVES